MSEPALLDLEARAQWHLGLGYPTQDELVIEHAYDDFVDPDDCLCFDCGQTPHLCECHEGDDCGRWRNGSLTSSCAKAGSEECDFECPYRNTLRF